jgi:hypothetical protein
LGRLRLAVERYSRFGGPEYNLSLSLQVMRI